MGKIFKARDLIFWIQAADIKLFTPVKTELAKVKIMNFVSRIYPCKKGEIIQKFVKILILMFEKSVLKLCQIATIKWIR